MKSRLAAIVGLATSAVVALPAGVGSAAPSGGCTYPPGEPRLTVSVSRPRHTPADSVTVFKKSRVRASGFFTQSGCGIGSASILVVFRPTGGTHWSRLGSHLTNVHGSYLVTFFASSSGQVRADFSGGGRFGAQDSVPATVNVV
jgi:hypothetical protein